MLLENEVECENKRRERTQVQLGTRTRAGFQEWGGPRSVSGEPIEDTTLIGVADGEMLPAGPRSGIENSVGRNLPTCRWTKLRRPHLDGSDFSPWQQAGRTAEAVLLFLSVRACCALGRGQAGAGSPLHPATQAGASVTSIMTSRTAVAGVRRMGSKLDVRVGERLADLRSEDIVLEPSGRNGQPGNMVALYRSARCLQ